MSTYTEKIRDGLYCLDPKDEYKKTNILKIKDNMPFKLGLYKDPIDRRDFQIKNILKTTTPSLKKIDYTNDMTPVKDQGNLGSCVAFAIASVVEYQQQREYLQNIDEGNSYRRKKEYYNLSEQWIYWNAKKLDPWGVHEEGTSIRCGLKVINESGVPPENGWPYKDVNKIVGSPEFWSYSVANWNKNTKYYRILGIDELKESLIEIGPVIAGVYVFYEFIFPNENGVISYPANINVSYGGHAISIVGFDDNTQLVKFKNSWGKYWGNNGYGYLPYKYIEDFMVDCWVTVDDITIKSLKK